MDKSEISKKGNAARWGAKKKQQQQREEASKAKQRNLKAIKEADTSFSINVPLPRKGSCEEKVRFLKNCPGTRLVVRGDCSPSSFESLCKFSEHLLPCEKSYSLGK